MEEDINQEVLDSINQPVIDLLQRNIIPWRITPKPYMGFAKN